MCTIITTKTDTPYLGVRQILSKGVLCEGEDELAPPKRRQDVTSIPAEARYALMTFLMARKWSIACDILAAHPVLTLPWASDFLRDLLRGGRLSRKDCEMVCAHICALGLVQTLGIGRARAFLQRLDC